MTLSKAEISDITFGDRTDYDEKVVNIVSDYVMWLNS